MNLLVCLIISISLFLVLPDRSHSAETDSSQTLSTPIHSNQTQPKQEPTNKITVQSTIKKVNLGANIHYFQDKEKKYDIDQLSKNDEISWQKNGDETPNFGVDNSDTWFKKSILFDHLDTDQYLLEIAYPALDFINIYLVQNGQLLKAYHTGDRLPFKSREVDHRNFLFPLPRLNTEQAIDIYVHTQTAGALQLPFFLWEKQGFWEQDQYQLMAHTFFFSILITLALYNFMLFLSLRDTTYLLYVAYIACLTISQMGLRGLNYQILVPEYPLISERMLLISIGTSIFFACLFARQFMSLPRTNPKLNGLLLFTALLGLLQAFGGLFMPYSLNLKIGILFTAIACPILLISGLKQWLNGYKIARFFTLAWIVYLIGQFAITLSKFGLLPRTTWIEHGPEIGAGLEIILLSFALADRMNEERRKRYLAQDNALIHEKAAREAQENALNIQNQANEELEARVNTRTQELRETLEELSEANEKLHSLSTLDGLTQVGNRRSFDNVLDREWRRCMRDRVDLSLLLLDADHFKQINDQYGHQVGDECLKYIAGILTGSVKRPADGVSRYGGEEFVIVLPNTSQQGAKIIAERIRSSIESKTFEIDGKTLSLTISIGLASTLPNAGHEQTSLIEKADQALYRAKNEGRNRVCISK